MISRFAGLIALWAGASIGLAGPASADQLDGTYTATLYGDSGAPITQTWVFTPCGADCVHVEITPTTPHISKELHLQGNSWTESRGRNCTTTIDNDSLAGTEGCRVKAWHFQLARAG